MEALALTGHAKRKVRAPLGLLAGLIAGILVIGLALQVGRADEVARRSDAFWGALAIAASNRESFDSLEAMTSAADAVVVGTITNAEPGRTFGDHPAGHPDPDAGFVHYLRVTLMVEEVIRGTAPPTGFVVEFILPNIQVAAELRGRLPAERALFFLRSKATEARSLDLSTSIQSRERLFYRLVTTEAILRDLGGRARGFEARSPFLVALEGENFEAVIDRLRHPG